MNNSDYNVKSDGKEKLFKEFVYGGKDKLDVLESYYNKITNEYLTY